MMVVDGEYQKILLALVGAMAILNLSLQPRSMDLRSLDTVNDEGKSSSNPRRICQQNPLLDALNATPEAIADKMDAWLGGIGDAHAKAATDPSMQLHDHARFFPFDVMAPCNEKSCVGGACRRDTSKIVCGLEQLQQQASEKTGNSRNETCVVYSIGGNNKWEFELDLLAKTPCEVHTFDCTGPLSRFQKPDDERIHFHHVCLGTQHEGILPEEECKNENNKCGETWTLFEMQQRLEHNRLDLLKIDIEGFEWPLFESWPELADRASDEMILPMQILVEVHYQTQFPQLRTPRVGPRMDFRFGRDTVNLQAHLLRMGYIVVERDDNRFCPHCTELTLVRTRCPDTGAYAGGAKAISY